MVSCPGDSPRGRALLNASRCLVYRLHFCRDVKQGTTFSRRFRDRRALPDIQVRAGIERKSFFFLSCCDFSYFFLSSHRRRTLGTPDDEMWPKVSELPNYKTQFPKWRRQPLSNSVPRLSSDGVDLLSVSGHQGEDPEESSIRLSEYALFNLHQRFLIYEPTARITCKEAQHHPYFDDLPKHEYIS